MIYAMLTEVSSLRPLPPNLELFDKGSLKDGVLSIKVGQDRDLVNSSLEGEKAKCRRKKDGLMGDADLICVITRNEDVGENS